MKVLAIGQEGVEDIVRQELELKDEDEIVRVQIKPRNMQKDFDIVFANFVLQRVPWLKAEETVQAWSNSMKAGGEIVVIVPSLEWAAYRILDPTQTGSVVAHIYGIQDTAFNYFNSGYTMRALRSILSRNGIGVTHARTGSYKLGEGEADCHIVRGVKRG